VLELIERDFGSSEELKAAVKDAKLSILKTSNALNPLIWGYIPLTVVDVWDVCIYIFLVAIVACTFAFILP
jgi:superoxide dismutase